MSSLKSTGIILMIMVMLMAAMGCSTNQPATSNTPGTTAPAATTTAIKPADKNAPIKVTLPGNANAILESGKTENANAYMDILREITGYKNMTTPINPNQTTFENINLMLASGDVPDLIYTQNATLFQRFAPQGLLEPVEQLVNQYGSAIKPLISDEIWGAVYYEGKKYAIPVPKYAIYGKMDVGSEALAVRQDWMDKLGLKAPKNLDELYNFLKAFKDANPNGKGTIPYVYTGTLDLLGGNALKGPFGLTVKYVVKDNKIVNTDDLYLKDCLEFLAKLYQGGLLDKEYVFNKATDIDEKITSGKAAVFCVTSYKVTAYMKTLATLDAKAQITFLPPVVGKNGQSGYSKPNPVTYYYLIPKTAKYKSEAVDFLNSYLSNPDSEKRNQLAFGIKGVTYQDQDGKMVPIQPAYNNTLYKIWYKLWNDTDLWMVNIKAGGYVPAMDSFVASGPHMTVFNLEYYKPPLEIEQQTSTAINDLRNEYISKIITGAMPLSALDEYFTKAKTAGSDKVLAAIQAWYDKDGKAVIDKINK